MQAIEKIVQFILETNFQNIPPEAVEKGKWAFLDTVGLILAGSTEPCGRIAIELVKEFGAKPTATVIGGGFRTSEPSAAFANGVSAHAHECDDADLEILVHPSPPIIPAILAVGESIDASGKDIMAAYIIGWEVIGGIGRAVQPQLQHMIRGWHGTGTIGTFGATAAVTKLLKLDAQQIRMALGIAGSEAAGLMQQFGTMSKPFHAGNAARSGVVAAMLAKKGFTADPDILESRGGFFNVFNGEGNYDAARVARKLGNPYTFISPGALIKKYACTATFQIPIEAMQELVKREGFAAEDVEWIEDGIHPMQEGLSRFDYPQKHLEAKFSERFAIAACIVYPDLTGLAPYEQERVSDSRVQELMKKIKVYVHPELTEKAPASVVIHFLKVRLKDGREFSMRADKAGGVPGNPLSEAELLAKYRDCAQRVLPSSKIDRSIELINALEKLEDISMLTKVLETKA